MTILSFGILAITVAFCLTRIWQRSGGGSRCRTAVVVIAPIRILIGLLITAAVGGLILMRAYLEHRTGPLIIAAVLELGVLGATFCSVRRTMRMLAACLSCAVPMAIVLTPFNGVHADGTRTVMWFVGHPAEMKAMLLSCRNDPGNAKYKPECENVTQAEIILAAEESRQQFDPTPPSDPRYWRLHPRELAQTVSVCPGMSPRARHYNFCDSAETAMKDAHR